MSGIPTIAEAAKLIAAKKLSPVELTRACLDRVHALDRELHSFVLLTEERALADARAAETAIMANGPSGPLHGIPIGLKDIVDTKGIPDDVPFEDPARQRARHRCDLRGQAGRGGHGADGQDGDARVRRWRTVLRPALAAGAQSLEHRAFHSRIEQRHRRRRGRRDFSWAASAPTPAARSAGRRRCAASPASRRPMVWSAAPAWHPRRSRSTISVRWRGPPRTAR